MANNLSGDVTTGLQAQWINAHVVFLLVNYVGMPRGYTGAPLPKNYRKKHIYLFFPFYSAEPRRRDALREVRHTGNQRG